MARICAPQVIEDLLGLQIRARINNSDLTALALPEQLELTIKRLYDEGQFDADKWALRKGDLKTAGLYDAKVELEIVEFIMSYPPSGPDQVNIHQLKYNMGTIMNKARSASNKGITCAPLPPPIPAAPYPRQCRSLSTQCRARVLAPSLTPAAVLVLQGVHDRHVRAVQEQPQGAGRRATGGFRRVRPAERSHAGGRHLRLRQLPAGVGDARDHQLRWLLLRAKRERRDVRPAQPR